MDERAFDISIAFDEAEYLEPQLMLLFNNLKDKLPEDTIIHVVTSRNKNDKLRKYLKENFPVKIYYDSGKYTSHLKSRCRYMLNCFRIKTDKPWVMKIEADLMFLKHLDSYKELMNPELDIIIEPENRKIHEDAIENRLWRMMYKNMNVKLPTEKMAFRENNEEGLPLIGTGLIIVKSKHLNTINKRWVDLTEKCEPWGNYNVHPNEQAFTGMVYDEDWNKKVYSAKYKLNPIGHYRKGDFPSAQLVENAILPEDTICLDWHRWPWLEHMAKYNSNVKTIIESNKHVIPDSVWSTSTTINKTGF